MNYFNYKKKQVMLKKNLFYYKVTFLPNDFLKKTGALTESSYKDQMPLFKASQKLISILFLFSSKINSKKSALFMQYFFSKYLLILTTTF